MRCLALALLLSACVDTGGSETLPMLDGEAYQLTVHVVVEARCATLDCHGDPGRPLRLYAEDGLRLRDDLRGQPVSADELAANLAAFAALPADLIIDKPMVGREAHAGGDVWLSDDDAEVVCLASWLGGATDETACATAAAGIDQGESSK